MRRAIILAGALLALAACTPAREASCVWVDTGKSVPCSLDVVVFSP